MAHALHEAGVDFAILGATAVVGGVEEVGDPPGRTGRRDRRTAHLREPPLRAAVQAANGDGAKPIWFTEIGCAAIDKGTNEPNRFLDGAEVVEVDVGDAQQHVGVAGSRADHRVPPPILKIALQLDTERARRTAAELGIPKAYGSYEELLADPEVAASFAELGTAPSSAEDAMRPASFW